LDGTGHTAFVATVLCTRTSWPACSAQRRMSSSTQPVFSDPQVTADLQVHAESPRGADVARLHGPAATATRATVNVTDGEYPVHPNTARHAPPCRIFAAATTGGRLGDGTQIGQFWSWQGRLRGLRGCLIWVLLSAQRLLACLRLGRCSPASDQPPAQLAVNPSRPAQLRFRPCPARSLTPERETRGSAVRGY